MDATNGGLLAAVLWTTVYTSMSAVAVGILLHVVRASSPQVHRLAWVGVILQAWLVYPYTIPVHVESSSPAAQAESAADSAHLEKLQAEHAAARLSPDVLDESLLPAGGATPNVAAEMHAPRVPRSWGDCLAVVWLAGAAVPAIWYVIRYTRFVRAVPLGTVPDRQAWLEEWEDACREPAIRRRAELRMTDSLGPLLCYVPFVYRVLVPRPLWVRLDCVDRLAILRHELAHLARGDLWKSAVVRLLALPQWFNPLIWWAVQRFDEAGEWACDDLAKGRGAEQQVGYAKTLVRLGELVVQTPAGAAEARGGCLSRRVHRLVHNCFTEDSIMKKGFVYLFLFGLTAMHVLRVELVAEERQVRQAPYDLPADAAGLIAAEPPRDASTIYVVTYLVKDLVHPNDANAGFDLLIKEIRTDVSPEMWGEDKTRIVASPANLCLVVGQTQAVHEELSDWLQARRRTKELQVSGLAPYVIEPPDVLFLHAHSVVPKPPYELQIFDVVLIRVEGTPEDHPIADAYSVQPDGSVYLGPPYGTVKLAGLTPRAAETEVNKHLRKFVKAPETSVSVAASAAAPQIRGKHLVQPDGTLDLDEYGSVHVAGMMIPQAEAAIMVHLAEFLQDPLITLDVLATNSKVYYIITDDGVRGDTVLRLPITGNETVLDAIAEAGGVPFPNAEIYVARSPNDGVRVVENLPVDWDAITKNADLRTNYALLPGDRIVIRDESIIRDLVDLSELELEILEQRQVLEDLEAKRRARIEQLGPDAVEKIIHGMGDPSGSPPEDSSEDKRAAAPSIALYGGVVSAGMVAEPPADAVRKALMDARPDLKGRELVLEEIASSVDEPRAFPIVGRAQLHNTRYRATIATDADANEARRTMLVDYRQIVTLPAGD